MPVVLRKTREWMLFPPLRGEVSGGTVQYEVMQNKIIDGEPLYASVLVISPEGLCY